MRYAAAAFVALLLTLSFDAGVAQELSRSGAVPPILRSPALSPDGKTLAFVYDGDIWTVASAGGTARRLTITAGNDGEPMFSPDGKWLAFRSERSGSDSIYLMPADGGEARRLTFGDAGDQPCCWLPNSSAVIFSSVRSEGARNLWAVRVQGGEPWPITSGGYGTHEYGASISPDGTKIAYVNRGGNPMYRRGYEGSASSQIWLCDFDGTTTRNHRRATKNRSHNVAPVFNGNDQILYITYQASSLTSNRVGHVAAMAPSGKESDKWLTQHTKDPRDLTVGGGKFAYSSGSHNGWRLYVGDVTSNGPARVVAPEIKLATDRRDAGVRVLTHTSAGEFAVSPDGKKIAFTAGGDVYVMPADEDGVPLRLTDTIYEEKSLAWAPDSTRLMYCTTLGGYLMGVDVSNPAAGMLAHVPANTAHNSNITIDPYGRIWGIQDESRLIMLRNDPAWGAQTVPEGPLHHFDGKFHGWALGRGGFEFSPDGRWILYTQPNALYNGGLVLAEVATGTVHPISFLFGSATSARFAADGKRVVFSNDQEDDYDIYVVDLEPKPPEFKEDKLDDLFKKKEPKVGPDGGGKEAKPEKKAPETKLVAEGLSDRVRRISSLNGNEFYPVALSDGKTYCFIGNVENQPNIWKLTLDPDKGPDLKQLTQSRTPKTALTLSADEKTLWWLDSGKVTSMPVAGGKITTFGFSVQQRREVTALRSAAFDETEWVMGRYFYDRKFHGIDWYATTQRYRGALNSVSTGDEYGALMNELLGELNSSHQGFSGWDDRSDGVSETCGWLGVKFDPAQLALGRYRVIEVLKGGPLDLHEDGPKAPFWILGIHGKEFAEGATLGELLMDTIGKKTVLNVNDQQVFQGSRPLAVKPISRGAESQLWYQRWVEWQREYVNKLSDGKLGYVHIRAMDSRSLREFKHHLGNAMLGKEGVVIDVRFNGGGSTAVDILEILIKRPWLKRQYGDRDDVSENVYRSIALEKPSILMINESSFSNAEIMAEGFRRLNIGKVVGVETAGGVIGTGSYSLIDGSRMRLPSTGAFTVEGENLENNGRKPDIAVENQPEELDKGIDRQTEAAVKALLQQIDGK
ncbi:MAG: PD40 domain-containing protein [Planctomycetes bacterium]|nr:PD40 domain-containing protein [Planctomycetota bacterium]